MSARSYQNSRKHADEIADWLVELGYTHCFFVAGGNIMHLLDAIRTRMKCVPVVHEVSAGIAAEYFNELSEGSKSFALVTAGPGVTNILTAISGAWLESRELLVLAGQVKTTDLSRGEVRQRGIQEIDGVALTKPISKRAVRVEAPITRSDFSQLVSEGWNSRPGPIFIEFCLDIQGVIHTAPQSDLVVSHTTQEDADIAEAVRMIRERLKSSDRPVLLLGGGVHRSTVSQLRETAFMQQIPIMTTWNAADRWDARNPNYLGRPNTWGQRSANLLLAQADLIIACGTRLGLQQTGFNWAEFGCGADIIQIDIDDSELSKGHPRIAQKICCDANQLLALLATQETRTFESWLAYGKEVQSLLPLKDPQNKTSPGYICPYSFFIRLSELSKDDDIFIPCSSGGANSVAMQSIRQKYGQLMITNKGLASMGYGLAGAIGSSFAYPRRRILLFEGDGGFSQNLQDLATVSVNRLNIEIFIFANNGYGSIRTTQKNYFGGAYLGCDVATGLGFPDWHKLFESYSIPCATLSPDWENELWKGDPDSSGPRAWILPIDPDQTYWPKITSQITDDGGMKSRPLHEMSPDLDPMLWDRTTKYL